MKFYSEVTKKLYDSEKELNTAEKEVADEKAKKEEAALAKKADATKVEEAFKAVNDAKREYNSKVVAARKMYNENIAAAKKAFDEAVSDAVAIKETAEKVFDAALKDFQEKHGSYHMTLKDGDNVLTISNQAETTNSIFKDYNNFLEALMKNWF